MKSRKIWALIYISFLIQSSRAAEFTSGSLEINSSALSSSFTERMLEVPPSNFVAIMQEFKPSVELMNMTLDAAIESENTACATYLSQAITHYHNELFKVDYSRLNDLWSVYYNKNNKNDILNFIKLKKDDILYRKEGKLIVLEIALVLREHDLINNILYDATDPMLSYELQKCIDISCSHFFDLEHLIYLVYQTCMMHGLPLPTQNGIDFLLYNFFKIDVDNHTSFYTKEFMSYLINNPLVNKPSNRGFVNAISSCFYSEKIQNSHNILMITSNLMLFWREYCCENVSDEINDLYTRAFQIKFEEMMSYLKTLDYPFIVDIDLAVMNAFDTSDLDSRSYVVRQLFDLYNESLNDLSDDDLFNAYKMMVDDALQTQVYKNQLYQSFDLGSLRAQMFVETDRRILAMQDAEYAEMVKSDEEKHALKMSHAHNYTNQSSVAPLDNMTVLEDADLKVSLPQIQESSKKLSKAEMRAARDSFYNKK